LLRQQKFKTQRGKRQLSTGSPTALIRELRQIYLSKTKLKKTKPKYILQIGKNNKNSKRNTTLKVKTCSFYWSQQSGDVSPTPSTWQVAKIFGLWWPDWTCYFRRALLTTGWWDPAVCHEPSVNVNNLGDDPLSTSEPWFLAIRFPNSILSPHKYLPVFSDDFCQFNY
jgi:hypothetical protein